MDLQEVLWVRFPTGSDILFPTIDLEWGSTQPHAVNWVAAWYEKHQNPVKKTEIKVGE